MLIEQLVSQLWSATPSENSENVDYRQITTERNNFFLAFLRIALYS
jgi:hypothetical protein